MSNARARSMVSCCFTMFDAFSREDLGHFSGHFSVVMFSISSLGPFLEAGLGYGAFLADLWQLSRLATKDCRLQVLNV